MATGTAPRPKTGTCIKCGTALAGGAKFCLECGTPVRVSGAPVTFGPRYAAFLVDLTAIIGLWFVVSVVVRPFVKLIRPPQQAVGLASFTGALSAVVEIVLLPLVAFLFHWLYGVRGETPGMRAVGIKLVAAGSRPGWTRSLARAGCFWGPPLLMLGGQTVGALGGAQPVAALLVGAGAGLLAIVWIGALVLSVTRSRRGLHDRISGTEIVRA